MLWITHSVDETVTLGRWIGELARTGQAIGLDGDLGAGKTQLVRGIAQGAGVADLSLVCSPTYVLLNIYPADPAKPAGKTLYHLDAYRVHGAADFAAVGFDELLDQNALVVLEWAARVPELLPADSLRLAADIIDSCSRRWTARAAGKNSRELLARLRNACPFTEKKIQSR